MASSLHSYYQLMGQLQPNPRSQTSPEDDTSFSCISVVHVRPSSASFASTQARNSEGAKRNTAQPAAHEGASCSALEDGAVTVITLHDGAANTFHPQLTQELIQALEAADRSPSVRAVVLTGSVCN